MAGFIWTVAANGYMWADRYSSPVLGRWRAEHRGVLVPRDWLNEDLQGDRDEGWRPEWAVRTYDPFDAESALFLAFADTPPTEDGVRAFADRYGHLGEGSAYMWPSAKEDDETLDEREWREYTTRYVAVLQTLAEWKSAIELMARAVRLMRRLPPKKTGPAARELQALVDEQLLEMRAVAKFQLDPPPTGRPHLHVVPSTLLGAMWVQLAEAVSAQREFRQCEGCRQWFTLRPGKDRPTKTHCAPECRSLGYRNRKARAVELSEKGWKPGRIARELKSDVDTVRGWLAE